MSENIVLVREDSLVHRPPNIDLEQQQPVDQSHESLSSEEEEVKNELIAKVG